MAHLHRARRRLYRYCAGLCLLPALASPLIAAPAPRDAGALHPHREQVCRPAGDGQWFCEVRNATPGRYPKPPVPPVLRDKPVHAETNPHQEWDWVPRQALTEEQRCAVRPGCNGSYVEPERDWPDADQPPEQAPLQVSADSSEVIGERAAMTGSVQLRKGTLSIDADTLSLDRSGGKARIEGNVTLRQPGLLLRGDSATADTQSGHGEVTDARFLHHPSGSRGRAARLARPADNVIDLEQASFTQCTPDEETWRLEAEHIHLDYNTGRGEARDTVLRVQDVPVFYTPYLMFPVDDRRMSGLLWPSIGYSDNNGLDLAVPYYFNLAPNYDATLAPRYIARRGTMAEAELRWLNPVGLWQLSGAQLRDDDQTGTDRWLGSLQEQGLWRQRWQTHIDYTKVSDNDYFSDLDISSIEVRRQTHLNQKASLDYLGERWLAGLSTARYQTIEDNVAEPYEILPRLSLSTRPGDANFAPAYNLELEATAFDHDNAIDQGGTRVTGQRLYAEPGIEYPMQWVFGYLRPRASYRYVAFDLDDPATAGSDDQPSAGAPLVSLDGKLFFERESADARYLQTLEPRLFYVYSEDDGDQQDQPLFDTGALTFNYNQLFRPRRFSGNDRLEDMNRLTTALTSRYRDNQSGRELLSASIGQIHYFEDREVQLRGAPDEDDRRSDSPLVARVAISPERHIALDSSLQWDARNDQVEDGGINLHYRSGDGALYNLGYRYRRAGGDNNLNTDLEQGDISAVLPLSRRWRLFARWNYDLNEHTSLEDLVGFEYRDCCWLARLVYQRTVDDGLYTGDSTVYEREKALLLEFRLTGLGSIGERISSTLEESIFGYDELSD